MKVLDWNAANKARLALAERSQVALYLECSRLDETIRESQVVSERAAALARRKIAFAEYGRLEVTIRELRLNLYLNQPRTRLTRQFHVLHRVIDHEYFGQVREDLSSLHDWAVTTRSPLIGEIVEMRRCIDEELMAIRQFVASR